MGSGGRRSPKGGLSNTGGAQKLKFKAMDPAAQNSMLTAQRQKQTGAALKAIHNYTDPTCYASNGFNHAQNLNQALNTGVERHIKYTKKITLNARRHNVKFRSIQII